MAKRVCRWCKGKEEIELMIGEDSGKTTKYYHKDCYYSEYLPHKEFIKKENEAKALLYEKVADIYQIPITELPKTYFSFIENIRNGEQVFKGQATSKRYKQGYDYEIIEKTYDYCRKDIEYWNGAKDFDSISTGMRYGLRIILDKINYVQKQNDRYKAEVEVSTKKSQDKKDEFASNYKKPKSEHDISSFLDD